MLGLRFDFLETLLLAFVFLISALLIKAQESEVHFPANSNPILIDEFGKINSEDLISRLAHLKVRMDGMPEAGAFIIIHRDNGLPPGFPYRYGAKMKTYLTRNLGVSPEKIIVMRGDEVGKFVTFIYLVEPSVLKNFTTNNSFKETQTFLFDSYNYENYEDAYKLGIDRCCSVDYMHSVEANASLDAFAGLLKANPTVKGFLIGYAQYCVGCISIGYLDKKGRERTRNIVQLETPKDANATLNREKNYLVRKHGIKPERLALINGGYKKFQTIELYFVPENGEIPKAQPETFPPRSKKRKYKR